LAIITLALIMLAKMFGVDVPDLVTGSIGVAYIGTAFLASIYEKRKVLATA
jgi:hypothetical protein